MSGEEGRSGGANTARPAPVRSQSSSSDNGASSTGTDQANRRRNLDDTMVLALVQQYFKLAGIVFVIWIVGYLGFSVSWLMLALIIYMWREKYAKIKEAQIEIAQHASRNEKSSVLARVEDLPSWVFFPDVERAEWFNKIIHQIWPYLGDYVRNLLMKTVEPKIKESLPPALQSFRFTKIDCGDIPPRIGGVKVYTERVKRDEILMDIEILYSSDADVAISIKGINAGIKDLQIRGTIRVVFKPLMNVMPLFGGLNVFFLNSPVIDFNLTSLANALDIPGLSEMLRTIVQEQVSAIMVLPNRISVALANNVDANRLRYPIPKGVLRIYMLGANDLKKADFGVLKKAKSDPYAVIRIGAQKFRTKVEANTVAPNWNEAFEAIIDEKSGQFMDIEVFDEDPGSKDDDLGNVSLELEPVSKKGMIDSWLPLEDVKKGMVHIKLVWLNLCNDILELDRSLRQIEADTEYSESLSSCLLMVCVDAAKCLSKSKKSLSEPNPYVELTVGQKKERTTVKLSSTDPKWEENFRFLVHDPHFQEIYYVVYDKITGKSLGEGSVPLKNLLSATNMTMDRKFDLKGGEATTNSKLLLQLTLRVLSNQLNPTWQEPEDLFLPEDKIPKAPEATSTASSKAEDTEIDGNSIESGVDPIKSVVETPTMAAGENRLSTDVDDMAPPSPTSELRQRRSLTPSLSSSGDHGRGRIQLTIRYSTKRQQLVVVVHKCINLLPCDGDNLADPYVRMYLLPDKTSANKRKTPVVKNSLNPVFDETFEFPVAPGELATRTLDISVKHNKSMFSSDRQIIGVVFIKLYNLDVFKALTEWFDLQPEDFGEKMSIGSEN